MQTNDCQPRVNVVQERDQTASPYLIVADAAAALDFYGSAFDAVVKRRLSLPEGKVMHAEMKIGSSIVMLADEFPSHEAFSPEHFGGSPVSVVLSVEDADGLFAQALAAGAVALRPMAQQPFGQRAGTIRDPFGHRWTLTTHIEDISDEEIERRFSAMMSGSSNRTTARGANT